METFLIAGATGALGQHVARHLKQRGYALRALTRDKRRLHGSGQLFDSVCEADACDSEALRGALEGVQGVFSCLGASVNPEMGHGRARYSAVDWQANRNLIDAAKAAGVRRFGYVSLYGADLLDGLQLDYVRAHEQVVQHLRASGLDALVVRPTGFFSSLESLVAMARKGPLPQLSDGSARTNPIHEEDLARVCVEALLGSVQEVAVGGPEVLTRRQINELAFAALQRPPKFRPVPAWLARAMGVLLRPINPRVGHLMAFFAAVTTRDMIAPKHGEQKLAAYFAQLCTK